MDLGLARLTSGEDRMTETGMFVGTAHYCSPEQLEGKRELDGRADLWALGVLLYELATGASPFEGSTMAELTHKVLRTRPRRPGAINTQISPFFEEVVLTLLAKNADQRFASAEEVLTVLADGEDASWWAGQVTRLLVETKRPLRRIRIPRETAVYGRDDDLARFRALFEKAKAGDASSR